MTSPPASRDFWLLWAGTISSNLGDGIRATALPLLTVSLTSDPVAVTTVTAASMAPWLFSLLGGAVVDRTDRRLLVLGGQLVRATAVAVFAALVFSDRVGLAAIYAVALLIGAGEVVVDSALQAAIPRVAGGDLERANSRIASGQFVAGDIIGGPLGGALFAMSVTLPFVIDAATFIVGAVLVGLIATPLQADEDRSAERPSIGADIAEGVRFLFDQPILRGMTAAVTLSNAAVASYTSLLVLLVTEVLDGTELAFGILVAVGAAGGLAGSLSSARFVAAFGRRAAVVGPFIFMVVAFTVVGLLANLVVTGIGSFVVFYSVALYNVSGQSIRQRLTPDRLLGRVVAGMRFFAMGSVPVGAIGGGLVARGIGVQPTVLVAAVLTAAATVVIGSTTAGRDLDEPVVI